MEWQMMVQNFMLTLSVHEFGQGKTLIPVLPQIALNAFG
jgi:hypothetical protein